MNEKYPDAPMCEKTSKIATLWNQLRPNQKTKYIQQAEEDKARYAAERKYYLGKQEFEKTKESVTVKISDENPQPEKQVRNN